MKKFFLKLGLLLFLLTTLYFGACFGLRALFIHALNHPKGPQQHKLYFNMLWLKPDLTIELSDVAFVSDFSHIPWTAKRAEVRFYMPALLVKEVSFSLIRLYDADFYFLASKLPMNQEHRESFKGKDHKWVLKTLDSRTTVRIKCLEVFKGNVSIYDDLKPGVVSSEPVLKIENIVLASRKFCYPFRSVPLQYSFRGEMAPEEKGQKPGTIDIIGMTYPVTMQTKTDLTLRNINLESVKPVLPPELAKSLKQGMLDLDSKILVTSEGTFDFPISMKFTDLIVTPEASLFSVPFVLLSSVLDDTGSKMEVVVDVQGNMNSADFKIRDEFMRSLEYGVGSTLKRGAKTAVSLPFDIIRGVTGAVLSSSDDDSDDDDEQADKKEEKVLPQSPPQNTKPLSDDPVNDSPDSAEKTSGFLPMRILKGTVGAVESVGKGIVSVVDTSDDKKQIPQPDVLVKPESDKLEVSATTHANIETATSPVVPQSANEDTVKTDAENNKPINDLSAPAVASKPAAVEPAQKKESQPKAPATQGQKEIPKALPVTSALEEENKLPKTVSEENQVQPAKTEPVIVPQQPDTQALPEAEPEVVEPEPAKLESSKVEAKVDGSGDEETVLPASPSSFEDVGQPFAQPAAFEDAVEQTAAPAAFEDAKAPEPAPAAFGDALQASSQPAAFDDAVQAPAQPASFGDVQDAPDQPGAFSDAQEVGLGPSAFGAEFEAGNDKAQKQKAPEQKHAELAPRVSTAENTDFFDV